MLCHTTYVYIYIFQLKSPFKKVKISPITLRTFFSIGGIVKFESSSEKTQTTKETLHLNSVSIRAHISYSPLLFEVENSVTFSYFI